MLPHLHPLLAVPLWRQLRRMGGPGLVLLGIADNSVIPLTGSMDVLTIWLAARHHEPWPYYALMATLGAVIGGYITYALARKGGKEAMQRKLSKKRAAQVSQTFERWGFFAVAVPAVLPPPFPFVPFLLAAGAMQYSPKKFLGALALGRGVRYFIEAGVAQAQDRIADSETAVLGDRDDLRRRITMKMHLRKALFDTGEHLLVPIDLEIGMQTALH